MMRLLFLFLSLLFLQATVYSQTRTVHSDTAFRNAILDGHNTERRAVSVAPLQWSAPLAADALAWAEQLAAKGSGPAHDPARKQQGENIWAGTAGRRSYGDMVGAWVREKGDFVYGPLDYAALAKVGHYTQIIWQGTTQVGCALASNGKTDYLVCRYAPAGNITGQVPYR